MAKKNKFPKTLFVFHATDVGDDPILISSNSPEAIGEENAGEPIGVYELIAVGKLEVEKTISGVAIKKLKVGKSG